ncbi:MAG: M28 family peptidase [Bryobacterales bacterium]|nr:M28 family peptidase [Bryobacterales bacterium]
MHRHQTLAACLAILFAAPCSAADFNGQRALESTRKAVALGQRPAGSAAIARLQAMIRAELKAHGWAVSEDVFTARTPVGQVIMRNIIGKLSGSSGRSVVFSGHYDTKAIPGVNFVGANDGGASTGWLLEMARVLPGSPRKDDVYLVFFDGEEAFGDWSDTNGIYGSRHLAAKWNSDGTLLRIKALFNVDMIGDKDLKLVDELNSSASLRRLVRATANDLGYGKYFPESGGAIEDDHMPFVRLGVNAMDLIDFDYGPGHAWWHTAQDTMDKLSAHSFQVVGDVMSAVFQRLEK